jgi:uncharacterized membrane protein YbhN (UPF0104 family)
LPRAASTPYLGPIEKEDSPNHKAIAPADGRKIMKLKSFIWPTIGFAAVGFSVWLLYHELRGISLEDLGGSLAAIPSHRWLLAAMSSVVAYLALAGYDHIALMHLGRKVPFIFITICSFTTYALSHNIGASVISGAVVRYRAYSSKGLSAGEIAVLVALCSFTFVLGTVIVAGVILLIHPEIILRFADIPEEAGTTLGIIMLAGVAFYVIGSLFHFRPLKIGKFELVYPRPNIVARQLIVGPLELIGAAGIIYFALPVEGNPGFVTILGIFVASFSAALISHAPGGLGVIEYIFVAALSEIDPADVIAALIIFRIFYLLIPFALSLIVILLFERSQMGRESEAPDEKPV